MQILAVVYRTGGTERFAWHRSGPFIGAEAAAKAKAELELAGYVALYAQDWKRSMAVGLPETFVPKAAVESARKGDWK